MSIAEVRLLETRTLGAALIGVPDVLDAIMFEPRHMSSQHARATLAALQSIHARGEPIGRHALEIELSRLQTPVPPQFLDDVEESATLEPEPAIARLAELYEVRAIGERARLVLASAEGGDLEATREALALASQEDIGVGAVDTWSIRDAATEACAQTLIAARKGRAPGVPLGLGFLDFAIGGVGPGNMVVVGAGTGVGKSTFALNAAIADAATHAIGIVSLEDAKRVWGERYAGIESGVSALQMRTGLTAREFATLEAKLPHFQHRNIFGCTVVGGNENRVCAAMRNLVHRHGAKIVYVDYLQAISYSDPTVPRVVQVARCASRIKAQAEALGIPVVLVSQFSRPRLDSVVQREPTIHDLKESGDIENAAEVIILLWPHLREEVDEKTKRTRWVETGTIGLRIGKCKWGARKRYTTLTRAPDGSFIEEEEFRRSSRVPTQEGLAL